MALSMIHSIQNANYIQVSVGRFQVFTQVQVNGFL